MNSVLRILLFLAVLASVGQSLSQQPPPGTPQPPATVDSKTVAARQGELILDSISGLAVQSFSRPMGESMDAVLKWGDAVRAARLDTVGRVVAWLRQHPEDLPGTAILKDKVPKARVLPTQPATPLREEAGKVSLTETGPFGPIPRQVEVRWLEYNTVDFAIDNQGMCLAVRIKTIEVGAPAAKVVPGVAAPPFLGVVTPELKPGDTVVARQDGVRLLLGDKVVVELSKGARINVTAIQGDWIGGSVTLGSEQKRGWVSRDQIEGLPIPSPLKKKESPDTPAE